MKSCLKGAMALVLTALPAASPALPDPVDLSAFRTIARPAPDAQLQYGPAQVQGVDVFLPAGAGPHPVVILLHGGCWFAMEGAGREQLRHLGADLARRGVAVWSIGYRRVNEPGGGYPGTFQDVGAAIDRLRAEAPAYHFDLARTVLVGHSAGGHLALWAAARGSLPATSPLAAPAPFVPGAVISLGGVGDLTAFAPNVPVVCAPGILERLAPGGAYAETSPAALPAPKGRIVMVSGVLDRTVPPYVAFDYARAMRGKRNEAVERVDIPEAGHFDLVMTGTPAWAQIVTLIEAALGQNPSRK